MSHRITLPSAPDAWADLKDSNEITRGEKKKAENARTRAIALVASNPLTKLADDPDDAALNAIANMSDVEMQPWEDYQNLMATICLVSWSYGKLPAEGPDFDAMADEDYEAIVLEARKVIFKEPLDFSPDGVVDPKAPTASSASSGPPSTATNGRSETTTPTPL